MHKTLSHIFTFLLATLPLTDNHNIILIKS